MSPTPVTETRLGERKTCPRSARGSIPAPSSVLLSVLSPPWVLLASSLPHCGTAEVLPVLRHTNGASLSSYVHRLPVPGPRRAAGPGGHGFRVRLCSAGPECWSGFTPGTQGHVDGRSPARTGPSGHPLCLFPVRPNSFFRIPSGKRRLSCFIACYKLLSCKHVSGDQSPTATPPFLCCLVFSIAVVARVAFFISFCQMFGV